MLSSEKRALFAIMLAVLPLLGAGCASTPKTDEVAVNSQNTTTTEPTTLPDEPNPKENPDAPVAGQKYKNGTFSATGNYNSPGGPETIAVSLTFKEDLIIDATVTPEATLPGSVFFQKAFADGYKTMVIGKNIDEVNLSKISGSSLTPQGFNEALEEIKAANTL